VSTGNHDARNDLSGSSRDVVQAGSVTGDIHFHHTQPAAGQGTAPRQLPADVHAFVNRSTELGHLDAALAGHDDAQTVVCVHIVAGTAGAGKTSLVLHWAHQVKDRFPDGQLFVNLRGYDPGQPVTAQQALRRFLRALNVPAADIPHDTDDAAALYRSLLAQRRMLIVLDNAATAAQVRPLLPGSGNHLVLVTSRSRLSALAVRDNAHRLTLGTLPEPEAVALLRTITTGYRPHDDDHHLTELARLCARLPLALRIAAERAATHPHLHLHDLITDLRDESALWNTLSTGTDDDTETVRTVFTWSYRALTPPTARTFRLLGLHPGPEFGLPAAAALTHHTIPHTRQHLDDLVGAHLLEQTAPDRYQFHDLLRAYATDQAHTEEPPHEQKAALRRLLDWYLRTTDAAQTWIEPVEAHLPLADLTATVPPLRFADYNAAVDWAEREYATTRRLARAAVSSGLDTHAWQLAAVLWNAMPPSAPEHEWLDTGRIGVEAAERVGDENAQALLLIDLGIAHKAAGHHSEALRDLDRALALARSLGNRLAEADALNLIGLIHLRTRRLAQAAHCLGEALAIFQESGEDHWSATVLSNVSEARLAAGRLSEAASTVEEALAAHREQHNRAGEGNALRITAALLLEQGDPNTARRTIDQALDIALALRDHTREAFWLLTLGDIQRTTGDYGDALASYQRSATLHRRLGDRSREALAWRGTGQTYAAMDREDEAVAFHQQAIVAHRDLDDAWQLAVELDHLATCLQDMAPEAARTHRAEALTLLAPYTDPRAIALRTRVGG
jgi:tetratricopeptide (TPR) repeat protein